MGQPASAENVEQEGGVVAAQRLVFALLLLRDLPEEGGELGQVVAVRDHPARAISAAEVVAKIGVRHRHRVCPTHPLTIALPARIQLHVFTECVLGFLGLSDRVDIDWIAITFGAPVALLAPDAAAFDLNHDHARVRHENDDVGLVVLLAVGDGHVRHQHVLGPELVAQHLPDLLLSRTLEGRIFGIADRHVIGIG